LLVVVESRDIDGGFVGSKKDEGRSLVGGIGPLKTVGISADFSGVGLAIFLVGYISNE
jgi:hypothetical protein